MFVKLKKDIMEDNRLKTSVRPGFRALAFTEGTVIEVSESTGKKWVEKGWAEETDERPERLKKDSKAAFDAMTPADQQRLYEETVVRVQDEKKEKESQDKGGKAPVARPHVARKGDR